MEPNEHSRESFLGRNGLVDYPGRFGPQRLRTRAVTNDPIFTEGPISPHDQKIDERIVMRLSAAIVVLMLTGATGCTSISSTLLNRTESDELIGNSNGKNGKHCETRPFKGVPITLRVPTHVDVAIQEKVRFRLGDGGLKRIDSSHRNLSVATDLIYTDKVFTVDVKRPAAGTSDYTMEFGTRNEDGLDNSQYFKSLENKIVDETIKDITGAIDTVFSALPSSTDDEPQERAVTYFHEWRTVAWKRFDIDELDFEDQVGAFVERHLNGCNSCTAYRPNNLTTAPVSIEPPMHSSALQMNDADSLTDLLAPANLLEE